MGLCYGQQPVRLQTSSEGVQEKSWFQNLLDPVFPLPRLLVFLFMQQDKKGTFFYRRFFKFLDLFLLIFLALFFWGMTDQ